MCQRAQLRIQDAIQLVDGGAVTAGRRRVSHGWVAHEASRRAATGRREKGEQCPALSVTWQSGLRA